MRLMSQTNTPTAPMSVTLPPVNITARYGTESAETQFRGIYQNAATPTTVTVLRNDGLNRHLAIRLPGTSMYWVDIITWPGTLAVRSDWGSWMFSRTEDMLEFFDGHYANAGYWVEKCVTQREDQLREFDEQLFRRAVLEHFWSWSRRTRKNARQVKGAWEQVRRNLLDDGYAEVHDVNSAIDAMLEVNGTVNAEVFLDPWVYELTGYSAQLQVIFHVLLWVAQNRALLGGEA